MTYTERYAAGTAAHVLLVEAEAELAELREAVREAYAAMKRRLAEDDVPAYYGPGSEWGQMLEAVDRLLQLIGED